MCKDAIVSYLDTMETTKSASFCNDPTQAFHNKQEQKRAEGAALSKTPLCMKKWGGRFINVNTKWDLGNAAHDPVDKFQRKPQMA